jgi:P-type Ca2+ transporter type 2C
MDRNVIREPFWSISSEETLRILETRTEGLSEEEAKRRAGIFGLNEIKYGKRFSKLKLFIDQFRSPLILILVLAAIVTAFLGDRLDTVVISAAVLVNVVLGFYQENKAENILELLKSYVKTRTRVRRQNNESMVDAYDLVPGDIIRIRQGDKIPADGRVIFASDFEVDESVLTGESIPVSKKTDGIEVGVTVGDRTSMVFGGTLVVNGFADVAVTSTGMFTEFGKITTLLQDKEESKTPLQIAISRFSLGVGFILVILTIILFGFGIYLGYKPLDMFLIAVAVAVSAVPESLPIALTVIMAVGVERLAKRKGVVRRLLAAETLGSTSLILTDKTGTLTEARMELTAVIPYKNTSSPEKMKDLLSEALTTVDVIIENPEEAPDKWRMVGNIMEIAMVMGSAKREVMLKNVFQESPVFDRLPFNSDRKFAASVHAHNGGRRMMLLGAPEILVQKTNLSEEEKKEIIEEINERAFSGERVLGVISKEPCPDYQSLLNYEFKDFNFHGLITFRDPLRKGVFESMERINKAGVKTIIVTGDHRGTAEAIARDLGLVDGKGAVLTGDDLRSLSRDELYARAGDITVYARVTPEQKVMIANMYKDKGEIVAMTGDGVNDAPALNAANIGIALGSGTDVTKSAADLVILDNNYETIVTAIEEGRHTFDNIRKVVVYLLSNSLDAVFLIGGSILAGLALPISAIQILFVNFFSDSFPAIAFAFEKNIDGLGNRPRRVSGNLFDKQMKFFILGIGATTSLLLFFIYYFLIKSGFPEDLVKTFIFATFATYTLLVSFSLRSLDISIFRYNPFSNMYLFGGVSLGIILTLVSVYMPGVQKVFGTTPLPFMWAVWVGIIGVLNILAIELGKFIYRKIENR